MLRDHVGFRSPRHVRLRWWLAGLAMRADRVEFTTFGYVAMGWYDGTDWHITAVDARDDITLTIDRRTA